MWFQVSLSLLVLVAVIRLFVQFKKRHINLFTFSFFLIVWLSVLFLNWNNSPLNKIGKLLGLERGADILVYVGLFLLFYYVFVSTIKFYKLEQDINKLVRRDAIEDFCKKYNIENKK